MKYIKEFRDPKVVKNMLEKLASKCNKEITIMEVCGTHTMSIFKNGVRDLLPKNIKLISGPGCPVCVTPQGYIDTAIELSSRDDVIITTFGDLIKIPGTKSTLQKEKALGRDIRIVYSPLHSLDIAKENPDKEVIFLGVGFETTAPIIALSVYNAKNQNINNYSVLHSIKTMPQTMKALAIDKEIKIDGFLCPGHVSTIIGAKPYEFLASDYNVPLVIAGFESTDIVAGIYTLVEMINNKEYKVQNIYNRLVKYEGNEKALDIMDEVLNQCNSVWRGLGSIENTGFEFKEEYKIYDVKNKLNIEILESNPPKGCLCGEILKGIKNPTECKLFGKVCNPQNPIGACMVSEEGTCAAYYKYGR
ncbi:hydrogenase formation protein HypD [Romboutsia sp.]|uniref:hydrogenase formation protein HypD n=1 Tax=Romboutsia sp. TaxID=1965302 RepID=UPI002BA06E0B|nr:hydrogenase formation protein HypD [Romboutsia sp.]HSQ87788.1 hydrogenase formation protein HypD [Romboutsia sp.]